MGWETEEQITDAKDKAKRNVVSDRGKDKKKSETEERDDVHSK